MNIFLLLVAGVTVNLGGNNFNVIAESSFKSAEHCLERLNKIKPKLKNGYRAECIKLELEE